MLSLKIRIFSLISHKVPKVLHWPTFLRKLSFVYICELLIFMPISIWMLKRSLFIRWLLIDCLLILHHIYRLSKLLFLFFLNCRIKLSKVNFRRKIHAIFMRRKYIDDILVPFETFRWKHLSHEHILLFDELILDISSNSITKPLFNIISSIISFQIVALNSLKGVNAIHDITFIISFFSRKLSIIEFKHHIYLGDLIIGKWKDGVSPSRKSCYWGGVLAIIEISKKLLTLLILFWLDPTKFPSRYSIEFLYK